VSSIISVSKIQRDLFLLRNICAANCLPFNVRMGFDEMQPKWFIGDMNA